MGPESDFSDRCDRDCGAKALHLSSIATHAKPERTNFYLPQLWSRMIFIRWALSEPNMPIAVFNSARGMTSLTSGSS